MKHFLITLIFVLLGNDTFAWSGTVINVHDGDTLQVQNDSGKIYKVRIYGVDCPELKQPRGDEARRMTSNLLKGKTIHVIPINQKSYGRQVAGIVLLEDMLVLQDVLITAGLAWVDTRYCKLAVCQQWIIHQQDAQSVELLRGLSAW